MGETPVMMSASWLALTSGVQRSLSVSKRRGQPVICDSEPAKDVSDEEEDEGRAVETDAREGDAPEGHFCSLKVEEVHQLDRLALAESAVVDPLGLVVQLELDGEDLDVFCPRSEADEVGQLRLIAVDSQKKDKILTKVDLLGAGAWCWRRSDCPSVLEAKEPLEKVERVLVDVQPEGKDLGLSGEEEA